MHLPLRFALAVTLGLLGLVLCPVLSADPRPVRLAFYEFGTLYDHGVGIDKDLVDELARRTGTVFQVQVAPRARIWTDLATGDLDMTVSGVETPARDLFAWFVPYITAKNYALVLRDRAPAVKTWDDFLQDGGLNFGVVASFQHGIEQDRMLGILRSANRVEESPNLEAVFKKLKEGRVAALFSQPPIYTYYLKLLGLAGAVTIEDWAPGDKGTLGGLVLSKARFSAEQARYWKGIIQEMRRDGSLKKIYRQYFSEPETRALLEF